MLRTGLVVLVIAGAFAAPRVQSAPQPAQAQQVRPTVYQPGSGVTDPVLKRKVDPKYPDAARRAGFGGEVWLAAVVLPDGTVGDIVVKRSLDTAFGLDDAAIAAARQWRFEPSRLNGEPVAVEVTLILEFRLTGGRRDPRIFARGPGSDAAFLAETVGRSVPGVVAPALLRRADIEYSLEARRRGLKGTVRVEAVVGANGRVVRVRIAGSVHPILDDAALASALEYVFRPAALDGQPVPVVVTLEIPFR